MRGYLMVGSKILSAGRCFLVKHCMVYYRAAGRFYLHNRLYHIERYFYQPKSIHISRQYRRRTFYWHFDDGTPPFETKDPATFTYNYGVSGTYYVTLKAIVCNDTATYQTIVNLKWMGYGSCFTRLLKGRCPYCLPNPAQNTLTSPLPRAYSSRGWGKRLGNILFSQPVSKFYKLPFRQGRQVIAFRLLICRWGFIFMLSRMGGSIGEGEGGGGAVEAYFTINTQKQNSPRQNLSRLLKKIC